LPENSKIATITAIAVKSLYSMATKEQEFLSPTEFRNCEPKVMKNEAQDPLALGVTARSKLGVES
jgi:hypothetical protein